MKKNIIFSCIQLFLLLSIHEYTFAQTAELAVRAPFEGMDLSWVNGQNRQKEFPLAVGGAATLGVYLDSYFNYNFANPKDNTQTISATTGRHNEFTLNLASIGIEANYKNMIGRLWLQTGSNLNIIQETDGSVSRGRNTSTSNLKMIREAAGGYHFDVMHGVNVEMGVFTAYLGLESYLTQENWYYQRSMVCDFVPSYFSGARVQMFPAYNYKAELWLMNGWQSYNRWSTNPAIGMSHFFRPTEDIQLAANFYYGADTRSSSRIRFHHDNSIVIRYHKSEGNAISQAAFSINDHYGFQNGDGVTSNEHFVAGICVANRIWFHNNTFALTLRGDHVTNPGLYLAFSPSNVTPNDFTDAIALDPKQKLSLTQATATLDVMPNDFVTFRLEYNYRMSNVPYFAGPNGTTSPDGWIDTPTTGWRPDLRTTESRLIAALAVRM